MWPQTQFEDALSRLLKQRTFLIERAAGLEKRGKPPKINRQKLEKTIKRLQNLAMKIRRREIVREFGKCVSERHQWHPKKGKGWGISQKKRSFGQWMDERIKNANYIYMFWSNRICEYVGRSIQGRTRPQSHFEKHWFSRVSRIDIWSVRKKSDVPKLECLAVHQFQPTRNKIRPAERKWTKKCPICQMARTIESELRDIFRLKKRRTKKKTNR